MKKKQDILTLPKANVIFHLHKEYINRHSASRRPGNSLRTEKVDYRAFESQLHHHHLNYLLYTIIH